MYTFSLVYEHASSRQASLSFPNGQTEERSYGGNLLDDLLDRITHRFGAIPISEFSYAHDAASNRITSWSQQAGSATPSLYVFGYDNANRLLSAAVTNAGVEVNHFSYSYDASGNRLTEQIGAANYSA